jgi:hypothetical protein
MKTETQIAEELIQECNSCKIRYRCKSCQAKIDTAKLLWKRMKTKIESKLGTKINIISVEKVDEKFMKENICPSEEQQKKNKEKDRLLNEKVNLIRYGKKWMRKEWEKDLADIKSALEVVK